MESVFIVLLDGRVCMFESVDDRFDSVCIKGEARIQLKTDQVDWCIRELLGNLGVDDLQEWSVTVIYDPVTSDLLSPVLTAVLPHKPSSFEVRSLESMMPELLLKRKMISPGKTVTAALGTQCWQVTLTEDGRVSEIGCLEGVTPDERLSECDIPSALQTDYTFTTNHAEIDDLNKKFNLINDKYIEKTHQIENLQEKIKNKEHIEAQDKFNIKQNNEKIIQYESAINELINFLMPTRILNIVNNVVGARFFYGDSSSISPKLLEIAASTTSSIITEKLYSRMKLTYGNSLKKETVQSFLNNNNCSAEILIELSHHDDFDVRKMIARHPNCPSNLLKLLINDKRKEVRDIAQSRINNI